MSKRLFKKASQGLYAALVAMAIAGCASGVDPTAGGVQSTSGPEARILVGNVNKTVAVIEHGDKGNTLATTFDVVASAGDMAASTHNHVFVNVTNANLVAAIDPVGNTAVLKKMIGVGQRPVHIYRENPDGTRMWVLNDGASGTGIDTITPACNSTSTSSVTVIQNHDEGGDEGGNAGEVLATICVGKGHHKAAFSYPTSDAPTVPLRTFISNIMDGTIHVIDNDPDSTDYLKVIAKIDLCDSNHETTPCDADIATPNGSGPHGMYYSSVSGLIYNNNETYGTETIIDPVTNTIVDTDPSDADIDSLDIGFAGATHITPGGEFILVRGTDRSDPNHVVGKLSIIDTADNSVTLIDLQDINIGDMKFTPDGHKLYVAVALTGTTAQKANQKDNVVLVYDASALPALPLIKEITVGKTAAGRSLTIQDHDGEAAHIFVTNRADGTVSVVDAADDEEIDKIQVGGEPTSILAFSLEGDLSHH